MLRFRKIPSAVTWTVSFIDLHTTQPSSFSLVWERGTARGETSYIVPDPSNHLIYNATFEHPCKIRVDKTDGHVRPKKLVLLLMRDLPDMSTRVYAALTVDVGQFYGNSEPSTFSHEMETSRDFAPTLHSTFLIRTIGAEVPATSSDGDNPLHFDDSTKRIPLNIWDRGDTDDDESDHLRKRRRRIRKPPSEMEPIGIFEDTQQHRKKRHLTTRIAPTRPSPPIVSPPEAVKPVKPLLSPLALRRRRTVLIGDFSGNEGLPVRPVDLMNDVFTRRWRWSMSAPTFIDDAGFPVLVFPVYATILHTKVLSAETDGALFDGVMESVISGIEATADTPRRRLVTLLAFILLIRDQKGGFDASRSARLLERLERAFNDHFGKLIQRHLIDAEILVNRFATAAFGFAHLFQDFLDLAKAIKSTGLPSRLDKVFVETAFAIFERRIFNKVLANPARLTDANATIWDSFLNDFENESRTPLQLLREGMSVLLLPAEFAEDPTAVADLCPNLPISVVTFLLANCSRVDGQSEVKATTEPPEPFGLEFPIDFEGLKDGAKLEDWCAAAPLVEDFGNLRYLLGYIRL